mmetsp:Transcript_78004/g.140733  ORF Transcript_78004/g.140733 Transcript_78004/m.140733 type:complete len:233 (-) Transcript_78004:550-1248(-)
MEHGARLGQQHQRLEAQPGLGVHGLEVDWRVGCASAERIRQSIIRIPHKWRNRCHGGLLRLRWWLHGETMRAGGERHLDQALPKQPSWNFEKCSEAFAQRKHHRWHADLRRDTNDRRLRFANSSAGLRFSQLELRPEWHRGACIGQASHGGPARRRLAPAPSSELPAPRRDTGGQRASLESHRLRARHRVRVRCRTAAGIRWRRRYRAPCRSESCVAAHADSAQPRASGQQS